MKLDKKNRRRWIVITIVLCVFGGVGCGLVQQLPDGTYVVDAEKVEAIDNMANVAEGVGTTVSSLVWLNPTLGAVGGLLVGIVGAWRKMKPQVETATSTAEIATSAGQATADAIEQFKTAFPDDWAKLETYLAKYHGQTVENFYRALRGLPEKL